MNKNLDETMYAMTYEDIAEQMSLEEGQVFTENQVKKIAHRAMDKLRKDPVLRSYFDFLKENENK